MKIKYICILFAGLIIGCGSNNPSGKRYPQFTTNTEITYTNDTLQFRLSNPLKCPLRFFLNVGTNFNGQSKVTLAPGKDTLIRIAADARTAQNATISHLFGDLREKVASANVSLPFPEGKSYTVLQSYNGKYSHTTDYSRYSLDFNLKTGDTVCAADSGYVVGVIKEYKEGGNTSRWKDYSNFITVYHPHTGIYTQYAHLKHNGSLVKVGDKVSKGQPIGLSGNTGWTNTDHLHFSVLVPVDNEDGLKGIPIAFEEGYDGNSLKINDVVKK